MRVHYIASVTPTSQLGILPSSSQLLESQVNQFIEVAAGDSPPLSQNQTTPAVGSQVPTDPSVPEPKSQLQLQNHQQSDIIALALNQALNTPLEPASQSLRLYGLDQGRASPPCPENCYKGYGPMSILISWSCHQRRAGQDQSLTTWKGECFSCNCRCWRTTGE